MVPSNLVGIRYAVEPFDVFSTRVRQLTLFACSSHEGICPLARPCYVMAINHLL